MEETQSTCFLSSQSHSGGPSAHQSSVVGCKGRDERPQTAVNNSRRQSPHNNNDHRVLNLNYAFENVSSDDIS